MYQLWTKDYGIQNEFIQIVIYRSPLTRSAFIVGWLSLMTGDVHENA